MRRDDYDAIVIGGGPAGSTAGALLAEMGHKVVILEKEKFPRYHVGESLLPYCYFTLDRLGLLDRMRDSHFTNKYSVQFVSTNGNVSQPFYFFQHTDHECSTTWQVVRDEFDTMLLDNAREKGAHVVEQTRAKDLIEDNENVVGVLVENADGKELAISAPITLDATGRDAFSMKRHDWRVSDRSLQKMAVWTYYEGSLRDEGLDAGATTVAYLPEKGWFWYIPLPNDMTSVGIVAEPGYLYRDGRDPKRMFDREIENNPWIREHLKPGRPTGKYWITSDYSYRSKHCARNGLVLLGDAFSFLDPIFSSGLFLALKSGELAADTVDRALSTEDYSAEMFSEYGDAFLSGIEAMRKLVYAFYDREFRFRDLLEKYPDLRGDLTDCLIGNLYRDFDPLFDAIAEFAEIPTSLPHGTPLVSVA